MSLTRVKFAEQYPVQSPASSGCEFGLNTARYINIQPLYYSATLYDLRKLLTFHFITFESLLKIRHFIWKVEGRWFKIPVSSHQSNFRRENSKAEIVRKFSRLNHKYQRHLKWNYTSCQVKMAKTYAQLRNVEVEYEYQQVGVQPTDTFHRLKSLSFND